MSEQSGGPGWWLASDGKWYPPQPGAVPPPPVEQKQRPGCWKIGAIVAVVLVVLMVGCAALVGEAADEASEDIEQRDAEIMEDAELVSCEADGARVRITNNSSERSNYSVDVVFESKDGSEQFESSSAYVSGLAPGQSTTQEALVFPELTKAFRCEITDVFRFTDE